MSLRGHLNEVNIKMIYKYVLFGKDYDMAHFYVQIM